MLAPNKLPPIPIISDSHWPIMRKKNINWLLDLHQFANIIFTNMIHGLNGIMIIGRPLKVSYIKKTSIQIQQNSETHNSQTNNQPNL